MSFGFFFFKFIWSFILFTENRTKRDVVTTLVERGFMSDPVKVWKAKAVSAGDDDESEAPITDYASSTSTASGGPDFQYLLTMPIMSLSREKKDELLRQRDEKVHRRYID